MASRRHLDTGSTEAKTDLSSMNYRIVMQLKKGAEEVPFYVVFNFSLIPQYSSTVDQMLSTTTQHFLFFRNLFLIFFWLLSSSQYKKIGKEVAGDV
jgi:hypothetical protein